MSATSTRVKYNCRADVWVRRNVLYAIYKNINIFTCTRENVNVFINIHNIIILKNIT